MFNIQWSRTCKIYLNNINVYPFDAYFQVIFSSKLWVYNYLDLQWRVITMIIRICLDKFGSRVWDRLFASWRAAAWALCSGESAQITARIQICKLAGAPPGAQVKVQWKRVIRPRAATNVKLFRYEEQVYKYFLWSSAVGRVESTMKAYGRGL